MCSLKIESFSFGEMVIDGKIFRQDLIILSDNRIIDSWWRKQGHLLQPEDLDDVIKQSPEILIIGQGAYGSMSIAKSTKEFLSSRDIELISAPTGEAYKIFNKYEGKKDKKIAGAFHLTC